MHFSLARNLEFLGSTIPCNFLTFRFVRFLYVMSRESIGTLFQTADAAGCAALVHLFIPLCLLSYNLPPHYKRLFVELALTETYYIWSVDDRVPTELKKAIMQARMDKKLTQSQLAQVSVSLPFFLYLLNLAQDTCFPGAK